MTGWHAFDGFPLAGYASASMTSPGKSPKILAVSPFYPAPPEPESTFGPRLLAYVDLLGWSELVASPRRADVLHRIAEGVAHLSASRDAKVDEGVPFGQTIQRTVFSDTIVYSCEPTPDDAGWLIDEVQFTCNLLLRAGHYTRGAIVLGDLLHQDGGSIVGRALVEAHLIERDVAKYPRLVVTDRAAPLVVSARFSLNDDPGVSQVRTDFDGLRYLDILGASEHTTEMLLSDVKEARTVVQRDLAKVMEPTFIEKKPVRALNLQAKYQWLLRYLDDIQKEAGGAKAP